MAGYSNKNQVVIEVSDNGRGIPQDLLENIFVPFFTTKEKGSGIGLSLSQQIIRLHGGTMNVESEPNVRTCFTIRLT
jgi:signal transduction histidine kinase